MPSGNYPVGFLEVLNVVAGILILAQQLYITKFTYFKWLKHNELH